MKKITAVFLAAILFFSFCGCLKGGENLSETTTQNESTTAKAKNENEILIGVFEAQSGVDSNGGKQNILAAEYAQSLKSSLTVGQENYTVKLDIADAGSTKQSAQTAAKKLVADKVSVVIGSRSSDALAYAADIFSDAGIAVIDCVPHSVNLSGTYSNIFNLCVNDLEQARKSAQYAYKTIKAKKAFVACRLGNDVSQSLAFYFKEAFEAYGASCSISYFEGDAVDFSELVQKAKSGKYDLFYAPVSSGYADDIIKECAAANVDFALMGSADWDVIAPEEKAEFDIYNIAFCEENTESEVLTGFFDWISFDEEKSSYAQMSELSDSCVLVIDAYNLALKAIKAADSTSAKAVLKKLPSVKYEGISGNIQFTSSKINSNAVCSVSKIESD